MREIISGFETNCVITMKACEKKHQAPVISLSAVIFYGDVSMVVRVKYCHVSI